MEPSICRVVTYWCNLAHLSPAAGRTSSEDDTVLYPTATSAAQTQCMQQEKTKPLHQASTRQACCHSLVRQIALTAQKLTVIVDTQPSISSSTRPLHAGSYVQPSGISTLRLCQTLPFSLSCCLQEQGRNGTPFACVCKGDETVYSTLACRPMTWHALLNAHDSVLSFQLLSGTGAKGPCMPYGHGK